MLKVSRCVASCEVCKPAAPLPTPCACALTVRRSRACRVTPQVKSGAGHNRHIEGIELCSGLDSLHAAQVLAHEFMHTWLWMQDFPVLSPWLEEGLCELGSFLYLLELLHDPQTSCLALNAEVLRQRLRAIEVNARPPYGNGFRGCASALRGRGLHDVLQYVRAHGSLPPQRYAQIVDPIAPPMRQLQPDSPGPPYDT